MFIIPPPPRRPPPRLDMPPSLQKEDEEPKVSPPFHTCEIFYFFLSHSLSLRVPPVRDSFQRICRPSTTSVRGVSSNDRARTKSARMFEQHARKLSARSPPSARGFMGQIRTPRLTQNRERAPFGRGRGLFFSSAKKASPHPGVPTDKKSRFLIF